MKINRNDPCWCGSEKKYKKCHLQFDEKLKELKLAGKKIPTRKMIKNEAQIEGIRKAAAINSGLLDYIEEHIHAGMATEEIDIMAKEYTEKDHATCADYHYMGFPKHICVSINDVVCHGIPSKDIILQEGDIVNVDATTMLDGYYADASRMFMIGNVSPEAKKLVEDTKKALEISLLSPKIGIILMLYFSVPLITEIDYILKLWLNNVPKGTSVLCISIITMFIIEKTTLGLEILLQAKGKIAKAQTTIAISYSLSILLAFIMIKANIGLLSIGAACILSMILSRIGIIFCAKEVTHIELTDWFLGLVIPIIILSLLLFSFSFLITNLFNASIGRLIANILLNAILTTFLSFLILFNHQIRKRIINFIIKNKEKG